MPTVLIMVMWFGGYVNGYQTSVQEFSSKVSCEAARAAWLEMVADRPGKDATKASCVAR